MKDIHKQTYYELLEISASASQEEILKAYNRARATYGNNSPALYSLFNKEEAQELLKLIDEAYAILSNQYKRKQYDKTAIGDPMPSHDGDFAVPQVGDLPVYEQPMNDLSQTTVEAPPPSAQIGSNRREEFGATRFGKYKIDSGLEETIKGSEEFPGQLLQKIRLYKNVTLDQIAESTKISRPYLMAIEANDYSCLPAIVFTRGFLVQIAKILGLDQAKVTNSYLKIMRENGKS